MNWDIYPLLMGYAYQFYWMTIYDEAADEAKRQEKHVTPFLAFLLKNKETGEVILVDSGPYNNAKLSASYRGPSYQTPDIRDAVRGYNVDPEDIKTVIITHLHWDHICGLVDVKDGKTSCKLPNAKIYVHHDELEHMRYVLVHGDIGPDGVKRPGYSSPFDSLLAEGETPFFKGIMDRFAELEGEASFRDGIDYYLLPGHTAGTLGLMINTAYGKYFLTSDLFNTFECWERSLPAGGLYNKDIAFESVAKAKKLASENDAVFVAPHDFKTLEVLKPFVQVPVVFR